MKLILPWLLLVAACAGAYTFYSSAQKKEQELAGLRAKAHELETLQQQNTELKKLEVQHDELLRLRKENEDVLRLRNEVRKLREESKQAAATPAAVSDNAGRIQQLQSEVLQLRSQLAQKANPQAPTPEAKVEMCLGNLRQIDAAKQQWVLENQKPFGAPVTPQDLLPYLPSNQMPACPTGGAYSMTTVGANPTCTIPGHAFH